MGIGVEGPQLRAGNLLLRPWRPEDADAVYRACRDPLIQRWMGVPVRYEREHAESYIESATRAWSAGTAARLGVFDAATAELLGASGLRSVEPAGEGELSFWTAPWARGRGVAVAAARATVRWAFAELRLRRVVWRAEIGNHASRLVAARLGVRFEGVARSGLVSRGEPVDTWVGALLPGELRDTDDDNPALRRAALRSRVFGSDAPTLLATTPAGEPVRLRPPRPADIPACVIAAQDPATARYTSVPYPYRTADAELFVQTLAPQGWLRGTQAIFTIAGADDAMVGTMDLRLTGDELTTEIGDVGYLVGPWARGRGYASTALRALTDWGFAALDLKRITWEAFVGNHASRATALRAGFQLEGELRRGLAHRGELEDIWLGARLATDP